MKQLLSIFLIFAICIPVSFAADLEIKVSQKSIKLPYWPAKDPSDGGVIIVQGAEHPEWSDFLADFASLLARGGWSTVLLNCSSSDGSTPWAAQLPEAIGQLRQAKNKRIVLIHYGLQLNTSLDYFSKPQAKMINGLVLLSAYDEKAIATTPYNVRFPILDVIGQFDYEQAKNQSVNRQSQVSGTGYLLVTIPGADHEYNYAQQLSVAFISGWMDKLPEEVTESAPIKPSPPSVRADFYIEPIYSLDSQLVAVN